MKMADSTAFTLKTLIYKKILLLVAILLAITSLGRVFTKSYLDQRFDNNIWGVDFYQFWYGAHFLWQQKNPYLAIQYNEEPRLEEPRLPRYYLNRPSEKLSGTLSRKWPFVDKIPGAAPMLLFFAPLAFISWINATLIWAFINLFLAVVCIHQMVTVNGVKFGSLISVILLALFLSLVATRQVIELGQNSLLVMAAMLVSFGSRKQHPVVSGILLGLAISKYTMAFPLFLYFLYEKRYKPILISMLTQVVGVLLIAGIASVNPLEIMRAYLTMSSTIMQQTTSYAIHLPALGVGWFADFIAVAFTIMLVVFLLIWHKRRKSDIVSDDLIGLNLMGIVCMWSMVVMYHGRQDMVLAFIYVVLVARHLDNNHDAGISYALTRGQNDILLFITVIALSLWILPIYVVTGVAVYRALYTICNMIVCGVLLWLLFRLPPIIEA